MLEPMAMHVLLLGRTPFDQQTVHAEIAVADVELSTGTNLDDVVRAFKRGPVDVVIMGAGISLRDRLAIIQHVFESSEATTLHMKDRSSGQAGMMPFVNAVLRGLTTEPSV
jgi:hypothetical protein